MAPSPAAVALDPHLSLSLYEEVLTGIYESVLPSVVQVRVRTNLQTGGMFGGRLTPVPSEGSGFVWSSEGHIVTNHHVIDGAERVMVVFANGLELEAEVLGSDPDSDLAALKVEPPEEGLVPVEQGDSDQLRVGQLAFAVGSPFGQEFSMTGGIVSALGRVIPSGTSQFSNPDVIQTDTPINPGNSGGPLLDRFTNVIGINAQILSRSGSSSGVGFAVPINTAKRIIPVLIEDGNYTYAYLGISGTSLGNTLAEINGLPTQTRGVLLVGIVPDGPADQAGLVEAKDTKSVDGVPYPVDGDVITAIDGIPVKGIDGLVAYMAEYHRPGEEVTLDVLNGGRTRKVVVELGARPEIGPLGAIPEPTLPIPG
jgi:2-alkenal reductase